MRIILILLATCLLPPLHASNAVETLSGTVSSSCAPWDGAALDINVDKIGLHVNLYGKDIQAFETGKVVYVAEKPGNMQSHATIKDASISMGFRQTGVELKFESQYYL